MNKVNLSVCIASFNGESYIQQQLHSILPQLSETDEVIIVDDSSTDRTVNLIQSIDDSRIKLYQNTSQMGHVKTFETAIAKSSGEYLLLSDQDDIWPSNRVAYLSLLIRQSSVALVVGNFTEFAPTKEPTSQHNDFCTLPPKSIQTTTSRPFHEFLGLFFGFKKFYGCTFMLRSSFLKSIVLPFPHFISSHDLWIAFCACLSCSIVRTNHVVLYRRLHAYNQTLTNRSTYTKIHTRFQFLHMILHVFWRRISFGLT